MEKMHLKETIPNQKGRVAILAHVHRQIIMSERIDRQKTNKDQKKYVKNNLIIFVFF